MNHADRPAPDPAPSADPRQAVIDAARDSACVAADCRHRVCVAVRALDAAERPEPRWWYANPEDDYVLRSSDTYDGGRWRIRVFADGTVGGTDRALVEQVAALLRGDGVVVGREDAEWFLTVTFGIPHHPARGRLRAALGHDRSGTDG